MTFKKIPSINGLRAISIFMVLFHHLEVQHILMWDLSSIKWMIPFVHFIQDGQLGVNVFFVISGFLITTLLLQEEYLTKTVSIKKFFIRRTLRIFPAYFFLLLIYAILQFVGYLNIPMEAWLTAVTYTKYFNWDIDWFTAHAWSLSVEEHFYLLWPCIFILGNVYRKYVVIIILIIVPTLRLLVGLNTYSWFNELTLFARIDAIAMGCFFALYQKQIINLLHGKWLYIFGSSIVALFSLSLVFHYFSNNHIELFLMPIAATIGIIANLAIALLMMYSIFGNKGYWFKMLNLRFFNFIGILSYSIYLWQQLFMIKSEHWYNQFPANIVCILMAALASYYLIEKPFLRLKSRFQSSQK
ncbi:acyltransferase [uncultured Cytophaga sp.]|uniref:acyltransferase family protein n=1 Tax=uncultured Cytophaga sp. TaxID=160238 RepID=UPI0026360AC2|nr:acyltransferase [uncultured Cytophaga sp.]